MIWLLKLLLALPLYILEWLTLPWILRRTPFRAKKLRWMDSAFGNRLDGLGNDFQQDGSAITMPDTWYNRRWPRFMWGIRNPLNNYFRNAGPNGTVEIIRRYGQYITVAKIGGKWWWMLHVKWWYSAKRYGEIKAGYKLWRDDRTNSKLIIGHKFQNTMAFSFQPWRKA